MNVNEETAALIAEARKCAPGDDATDLAVIVHRLADALEAATRVPVQGESRVYLHHEDGTPKSNDEIRHEAAALGLTAEQEGETE